MTFDRKEYTDFVGERQKREINGRRQSLEVMQQAAVKADLLTGDVHWDTFLSYLEAGKEAFQTELDALIGTLTSPQMVNADEIMKVKARISQLQFGIGVVIGIISLPSDIKKQGDDAENLLSKLDG